MAIDGWVLIGVAVAMAVLASPLSPAARWTDEFCDRGREPARRRKADGRPHPDEMRGGSRRPFRERPGRAARNARPPARAGQPADPD